MYSLLGTLSASTLVGKIYWFMVCIENIWKCKVSHGRFGKGIFAWGINHFREKVLKRQAMFLELGHLNNSSKHRHC